MTASRPIVNRIELAKILNSLPIFGGVEGEPTPTDPPAGGNPTTPPAGGSPTGGEDPIEKLRNDPNALAQLLSQSQQLQNQVGQLTTQLGEATTKLTEYDTAAQEAARAQQTKEEQLATDVTNLQAQVEKLTNILHQKVIENAIANNSAYQWNSTRQVQGELDLSKLKVNIDVDKGIAEIQGMDDELKRIAEGSPWLVKQPDGNGPTPGEPSPRSRPSGNPPRPPTPPGDKSGLREKAMKRYPALAAGMRGMPG